VQLAGHQVFSGNFLPSTPIPCMSSSCLVGYRQNQPAVLRNPSHMALFSGWQELEGEKVLPNGTSDARNSSTDLFTFSYSDFAFSKTSLC